MKLIIFDVDGTLVDSQQHIHSAMSAGFANAGLPPLEKDQVLRIVGLSLPVAVAELVPDQPPELQARIVEGYREAFAASRLVQTAPLYPGAMACLDALSGRDDLLLAIATGKPRRGLDAVISAHGLQGRFISLQTADGHPSKPHPAMLESVLSETGMQAEDAVMIGDTSYDMMMAAAAGMTGFGVAWGYHRPDELLNAGAALVAPDFATLTDELEGWAR